MNGNNKFKTTDLVYIAICAVMLAVCSWISIPTAVPFTMQTFGVFCVLLLLGGKRGTLAIVVFLLLGAIGLPVFAGFSGGMGSILGSTGGYLLGFIFIGLIYWITEALLLRTQGSPASSFAWISALDRFRQCLSYLKFWPFFSASSRQASRRSLVQKQ